MWRGTDDQLAHEWLLCLGGGNSEAIWLRVDPAKRIASDLEQRKATRDRLNQL